MLHCWNNSPDVRPSFANLVSQLEELLKSSQEYLDISSQPQPVLTYQPDQYLEPNPGPLSTTNQSSTKDQRTTYSGSLQQNFAPQTSDQNNPRNYPDKENYGYGENSDLLYDAGISEHYPYMQKLVSNHVLNDYSIGLASAKDNIANIRDDTSAQCQWEDVGVGTGSSVLVHCVLVDVKISTFSFKGCSKIQQKRKCWLWPKMLQRLKNTNCTWKV